MMALPGLLVVELGLNAACFICGIVAAASVTIIQGQFAGRCMLYGSVGYNVTAQSLTVVASSSPSLCYFVSAISVCVAIYCFSLTLYWVYTYCMDQDIRREQLWMNVTLVVCGVFLFFLLVSGCVLNIGKNHLCESILHTKIVNSCDEAQNKTWVSPYSGTRFYARLHSAETSVWVNFFFWLVIVGVVIMQRHQVIDFGSGGTPVDGSPSETDPFLHRPGQPQ
ncbi:transmembrane protein 179B [Megalops cyprinoides]|uniref:transmembrane protein 179B n=1 Tax=Megalops cyprinoides TaxID=118141 RepID=UPI001864B88E|nr:transmembrane protein 179B [Megalops cyprinoides]